VDPRKRKAREIQGRIREVLLREWNPIGCGVPEDEYDAYIGGVYRLLAQGASTEQIAGHLAAVEHREIGFDVTPESLKEVAAKLNEIDVNLDNDNAT
jgi:hypothetical protein